MVQGAQNARLTQRAYWLVHLRWMALLGVSLITLAADQVFSVEVQILPIFIIIGLLVVYNLFTLFVLKRITCTSSTDISHAIRRIIHFQISTDLVLLTVLLHYSGGIENPFTVYFVFHMAIASSLLTVRESYLQATLAVCLLSLMVWLEFSGVIQHYCLKGFVTHDFHADGFYILGTVAALASMLYLVVFMTSNIATKLREQECACRHANEILEQQDRIKDEYVARVTHDIKGHLAAIQSCHEVVISELKDPLSEQQSNFIKRAHQRTAALSKFVRSLLELTEMRLSDQLEMGMISLREIILSVVTSVKSRAQEKGIALTYAVDPQVNEVYGNFFSLEETITNLVLNAIKYTPDQGKVDIQVYPTVKGVRLDISDTGIGIPSAEMSHVFDEFFRASNARKTEKDGTGLGLSIAKQIVERHGGTIGVQARPGGGTIFNIVLPDKVLSTEVTVVEEVLTKKPPIKTEGVRL